MDQVTSRKVWRVPAAALLAVALTGLAPAAVGDGGTGPGPERSLTDSSAAPAPMSSHPRGATSTSAAEGRGDQAGDAAGLEDYWTPERMESAIPVDPPRPAPSTDQFGPLAPMTSGDEEPEPLTLTVEPVPAQDAEDSPPVGPGITMTHTNGKVFYVDQTDGLNYVCSGSAVNSPSRRLVVTAGHCVHGGGPGRRFHARWVFVPGYDRGTSPHGTFAAAAFRTLDDWVAHGPTERGFSSDVAFVTTSVNTEGETVVDAVGGHGLTNGGSHEFEATLFGYPGNLEAGERMKTCAGTTEPLGEGTYRFVSIRGCGFGPGSSGGPWLHQYGNATGLGYVRSVTSFGPSDSNAFIAGPYFDQRITDMYFQADGDGREEEPQ